MNNKIIFGAIGCLVLSLALFVVGVAGLIYYVAREFPTPEGYVQVEPEIRLGQVFTLKIVVTNPHPSTVELDDIDIDESLLEGLLLQTTTPKLSGPTRLDALEQRSFKVGKKLEPGESFNIELQFKAVEEGHWSGDIDLTNPNQDFHSLFTEILVSEEEEEKSPSEEEAVEIEESL